MIDPMELLNRAKARPAVYLPALADAIRELVRERDEARTLLREALWYVQQEASWVANNDGIDAAKDEEQLIDKIAAALAGGEK